MKSISVKPQPNKRALTGLDVIGLLSFEPLAKVLAAERPKHKAQGGAQRNPG